MSLEHRTGVKRAAATRLALKHSALSMVWITVLVGCEFPSTRFVMGLSADERAEAAQMPVHRERLAEDSYKTVGPVTGFSCQITHDDDYRVAEENAIEELQRAAFVAGGNAVVDVVCEPFGWHQGTRSCFRSIECRGTAVRTRRARDSDARSSVESLEQAESR